MHTHNTTNTPTHQHANPQTPNNQQTNRQQTRHPTPSTRRALVEERCLAASVLEARGGKVPSPKGTKAQRHCLMSHCDNEMVIVHGCARGLDFWLVFAPPRTHLRRDVLKTAGDLGGQGPRPFALGTRRGDEGTRHSCPAKVPSPELAALATGSGAGGIPALLRKVDRVP